jgi:hypothetical protein
VQIRSVTHNNRKKLFEVGTSTKTLVFPFSKAEPAPTAEDPVTELSVDVEAGREAFSYVLHSGRTGTVHVEQMLEYNQDPTCLRDLLLYRLTLEAQKRVAESPLSKREIVRRLGTSAAQLYRLLDQTNYRKSVGQRRDRVWRQGQPEADLARRRRAFEDADAPAGAAERDGGRQSADTGADDERPCGSPAVRADAIRRLPAPHACAAS